MSATGANPTDPQSLPPGAEPCPAPLNWAEVVQAVAAETQTASIPCPGQGDDSQLVARVYGSGPPLYLLGGATGSSFLFDLTAYLLRETFTTVRLEHPNNPLQSLTLLETTGGSIRELVSGLGHEQPAIYAAGYGCDVALDMQQRQPGFWSHLFLQNPSVTHPMYWRERFLHSLGRFFSRPMGTLPGWKAVQIENHQRYFPPFDGSRFEFLLNDLATTPVRDVSCREIASFKADWSRFLPALATPVVVIRTEGEGRTLELEAERFASLVPQVTTDWMHSAGHYPYLTHPHRLVKLLKQYLLSQPVDAGA